MVEGLDWFSLIVLLGAVQGFIISVSILRLKKGSISTNRFLATFIFIISITLLGRFFYTSPQISILEFKVLFVGDLIIFLFGPLLYFYLLKLFSIKIKVRLVLHLLPAAAYTIFTIPFLVANRQEFILMSKNLSEIFKLFEIFAITQNLFYLIFNYQTLNKFLIKSEKVISYKYQIQFYKVLLGIIAAGLCAWLISLLINTFGPSEISGYLGYHLVWILLSISIIALGYYTMSNPEVFSEIDCHEKSNSSSPNINIDEGLITKLEKIMSTEKPYLQPKLTLSELAEKCEVSVHHLSRSINKRYKRNFFEFVNSYRVNEFINLIESNSDEKLTLLALAYQSGFNSKTTFNTAFKKITGKTPKEYIKSEKAA